MRDSYTRLRQKELQGTVLPEPDTIDATVSAEAHRRFGYAAAEFERGNLERHVAVRHELEVCLRSLNIPVFTPASVQKMSAIAQWQCRPRDGKFFRVITQTTNYIGMALLVVTVGALVAMIVALITGILVWWACLITAFASFVLAVLSGGISIKAEEKAEQTEPTWTTEPLRSTNRPIPAFALELAIAIANRCDGIGFSCTYLEGRHGRKIGGFLTLTLSEDAIHVTAWREWRYDAQPYGISPASPGTEETPREHRKVSIRKK